ncbi:MAG: hypothetical protein WC535_08345 [Candidatus Cloacimonas sp.]
MGKKYYGHPDFYKMTQEEIALHNAKNYQYASSENPLGNFKRVGVLCHKILNNPDVPDCLKVGMVFMAKQIDAVYDIIGEGKTDIVEQVEDKFRDISVYSKINCIMYKEWKNL